MPFLAFCEPVAAGVLVSLINRYIISNNHLCDYCYKPEETLIEHDDSVSSSSITTTDAIEIHAHF